MSQQLQSENAKVEMHYVEIALVLYRVLYFIEGRAISLSFCFHAFCYFLVGALISVGDV